MSRTQMHPTLLRLLRNRFGIPRDEALLWLREGRIRCGDELLSDPMHAIEEPDALRVQGDPMPPPRPARLLLMHKPRGHITGRRDPGGRPVLTPYLPPESEDLRHVGRLDFNTTGLLLWTNSGQVQRALLDPSHVVPKLYRIKVRDRISEDDPRLARLASGTIVLDGTPVRPCEVQWECLRTRATWIRITLTEGRFRQLRRMCAAVGFQIVKLERIAIGALTLPPDLTPRCVRVAEASDWDALLRTLALDAALAPSLAEGRLSVDALDEHLAERRREAGLSDLGDTGEEDP